MSRIQVNFNPGLPNLSQLSIFRLQFTVAHYMTDDQQPPWAALSFEVTIALRSPLHWRALSNSFSNGMVLVQHWHYSCKSLLIQVPK